MINETRNAIDRHRPGAADFEVRIEEEMRFGLNSDNPINGRILFDEGSI